MLSQSHFIAFKWHKIQTFSKRVEELQRLHYQLHTSTSRSRIRQNPRLSLHARKFCRPILQESVSQNKVAARLWLNVCWCTSEAGKFEKRNHNDGHDDSLFNCNIGWKKYRPYCRSCTYSIKIFTNAFVGFTRKWWLSFKVGTWKFIKIKLLNLINSMKADFIFASLNRSQKEVPEKKHILRAML